MPIDGSGNFSRSYDFTNDRDLGIKILSSRMDGEFNNFAAAINTTLYRNGLVPMTGNLSLGQNYIIGLGSGSSGALSVRFNDDAASGMYLNGIGKPTIVQAGNPRLEANSFGCKVYGSLEVSGSMLSAKGTTASTASATLVDLFTITGNVPRIIILTAGLYNADAALYTETAILTCNGDGGAGPTVTMTTLSNGASFDIVLSGAGNSVVRARQFTGGAAQIWWSYTTLSSINP